MFNLRPKFQISFTSLLIIFSVGSAFAVSLLVGYLLVYRAFDMSHERFLASRLHIVDTVEQDRVVLAQADMAALTAYLSGIRVHRAISDAAMMAIRADTELGNRFDDSGQLVSSVIPIRPGIAFKLEFNLDLLLNVSEIIVRNVAIFALIYALGVIVGVYCLIRYWRHRIFELKQMAVKIAHHREIGRQRYSVTDFEDLANAFRKMGDKLRLREEQLTYSLGHDTLTGLHTLDHFQSLLHTRLLKPKAKIALLMLDISHFRVVNQNYGHEFGNRLLCYVALRIQRILGREAVVARTAADQFAVMLNYRSESELDEICRQLLKKLNTAVVLKGRALTVSVHIGVVFTNGEAHEAQTLIHRADTALSNAKNANIAVCYHDEVLFKQSQRFLRVIRSVKEGEYNLAQSGFGVHYQPKYNLRTGALSGVEALVRWRHPDLGFIEAQDIVNAATESSMLGAITYRIVDLIVEALLGWRQQGLDICVSLNIGPSEVADDNFIAYLERQLQAHQLSNASIELEITEHAILENDPKIQSQLDYLHNAGFSIAIDDFGVGYANFRNLQCYPFSVIKIDRGFISQMTLNPRDKVIVDATLQLAHDLGMQVVAEGVEDFRCARELISADCDYVQGYLFSRPVTREAVPALYFDNQAGGLIKQLNFDQYADEAAIG